MPTRCHTTFRGCCKFSNVKWRERSGELKAVEVRPRTELQPTEQDLRCPCLCHIEGNAMLC